MQLPGGSSDDVVEVSREGVPTRRHEPICAGNSSTTMKMRWSATLAPTRLPECCTTVPTSSAIATGDATPVRDDGAAMRTVRRIA